MPKAPRNPKEVAKVREGILNAALNILMDQGFKSLSMRKIAGQAHMTAANLYNYFSNKDEIYLAIQTRGFALLYDRFQEIDQAPVPPLAKMQRMIRTYMDFGVRNPDQYEIMFTRNTPKYRDYVGTPLEPAAAIEKQTALNVAALATKVILDLTHPPWNQPIPDADFRTVQLWTALHGVVSLLNSRVLQEVDDNTQAFIEKMTGKLLEPFQPNPADNPIKGETP